MTTEEGAGRSDGASPAAADRRRALGLAAAMAAGSVVSWLVVGGAELLDQVAAARGTGTAALLAAGGSAAVTGIIYGGVRLFGWAWSKLPDPVPCRPPRDH